MLNNQGFLIRLTSCQSSLVNAEQIVGISDQLPNCIANLLKNRDDLPTLR